MRVRYLDGDVAVQLGVESVVDAAEGAVAEDGADLVPADAGGDAGDRAAGPGGTAAVYQAPARGYSSAFARAKWMATYPIAAISSTGSTSLGSTAATAAASPASTPNRMSSHDPQPLR